MNSFPMPPFFFFFLFFKISNKFRENSLTYLFGDTINDNNGPLADNSISSFPA